MGRTACTEPQCLYKGALYLYLTVELYLYSPYGPYGLYRASVPVQGCTLPLPYSRAIPLLPLWAVLPVQSLSACTRVHFTFYISSKSNNKIFPKKIIVEPPVIFWPQYRQERQCTYKRNIQARSPYHCYRGTARNVFWVCVCSFDWLINILFEHLRSLCT